MSSAAPPPSKDEELPVKLSLDEGKGPLWRRYLQILGPGLVTGASDDDPSGIATYSQVGAQYGLSFLWTALFSFPMMACIQEICDRAALATGKGLGELAVARFHRWGRPVLAFLLFVLIVANTLNIAADLVAIGSGMHLLHAGAVWVWALIAGVAVTATLASGSYTRVAQILKFLCIGLFAYIIVAVIVTHNWVRVAEFTFIPHVTFSRQYAALLVAVLGTTISPYLFFWQSAYRLEEMRDDPVGGDQAVPLTRRSPRRARRKEKLSRVDVFSGMGFSNLVMFTIIAATAATLHNHHITNVQSAAQAARALRPIVGSLASTIFALGFIGSGLLAVPVLAASGSAGLSGVLGKEYGFSRSVRKAPLFYALVAVGTLGGTALSLIHINPFKLLILVAVINGVVAAPFLFIVMRVSGNREIMGNYVNGKLARTIGWLTTAVMGIMAVVLFATGGVSL